MSSVNISEKEFHLVAEAASTLLAQRRTEEAYILDDLARKMNHALSRNTVKGLWRSGRAHLDIAEVESPLESSGKRPKKGTHA